MTATGNAAAREGQPAGPLPTTGGSGAGSGTAAPGQPRKARVPKTGFKRALGLGLLTFAALFGGLGGWMALTKISGAVVASGSVAVKGEAKTVQHLDGGIVSEIAIANGDIVKAGDRLAKLDETLLQANLKIYHNRLSEALARRARLIAERVAKTRSVGLRRRTCRLGWCRRQRSSRVSKSFSMCGVRAARDNSTNSSRRSRNTRTRSSV